MDESTGDRIWHFGDMATMACLFEATAPKLGNVHPGARFTDMAYDDFVRSSYAIGRVFAKAGTMPVGALIREAVSVTRQVTLVNTNLGTILLLGPLTTACYEMQWSPQSGKLEEVVDRVLKNLTSDDSKNIYDAIRIAQPGGLGKVDQMDIADSPPSDILHAMQHAAERDMIACEYVNRFERTRILADRLSDLMNSNHQECNADSQRDPVQSDRLEFSFARVSKSTNWLAPICQLQLESLARWGDSLIGRKCGVVISDTVRQYALAVQRGQMTSGELDNYLRADGHRRNPGATADLIAAATFLTLCRRSLEM